MTTLERVAAVLLAAGLPDSICVLPPGADLSPWQGRPEIALVAAPGGRTLRVDWPAGQVANAAAVTAALTGFVWRNRRERDAAAILNDVQAALTGANAAETNARHQAALRRLLVFVELQQPGTLPKLGIPVDSTEPE